MRKDLDYLLGRRVPVDRAIPLLFLVREWAYARDVSPGLCSMALAGAEHELGRRMWLMAERKIGEGDLLVQAVGLLIGEAKLKQRDVLRLCHAILPRFWKEYRVRQEDPAEAVRVLESRLQAARASGRRSPVDRMYYQVAFGWWWNELAALMDGFAFTSTAAALALRPEDRCYAENLDGTARRLKKPSDSTPETMGEVAREPVSLPR